MTCPFVNTGVFVSGRLPAGGNPHTVAYPSFSHALTLLKLPRAARVSTKGPLAGLPTQGKDSGTKAFFVRDRKARKIRKATNENVSVGRAARTSPRSESTLCIVIETLEGVDKSLRFRPRTRREQAHHVTRREKHKRPRE